MDNIRQTNEEQFQMLCLAVENMNAGICLFYADSAGVQSEIAKRISAATSKSCCILDMSEADKNLMPDEIGKLRALMEGKEEVQTVILCNLQLCGENAGDEYFIQKFNYMRDQMTAMEKIWILGMTKYFSVMLGQNARDLYSCIMNHFGFAEEKESLPEFAEPELYGDKGRSLLKLKSLYAKFRNQDPKDIRTESLIEIISSWNEIYDSCSDSMNSWIKEIITAADARMENMNFTAADCVNYQKVARAWSRTGDNERALKVAKRVEEHARELLPASGKETAELYILLAMLYICTGDTDNAEIYVQMAKACDTKSPYGISRMQMDILNAEIQVRVLKGETEHAVQMYQQMIEAAERNFGKNDYYMVLLWNNLGIVYTIQENYSKALECFSHVRKLTEQNSQYVHWRYTALKNAGIICGKIGDYKKAAEYLTMAKEVSDRLEQTGIHVKGKEKMMERLIMYQMRLEDIKNRKNRNISDVQADND